LYQIISAKPKVIIEQVEREITKNSGSVDLAVSLKYFTEQKISTN